MIIVVIVFSVIYIILLTLILIAYYRDTTDLEKRILDLEKRVNEIETNNDMLGEYYERTNAIGTIQEQILKYIDIQIKKENNTQEGCVSEMPCGRKKGRGGKRK